MICALLLQFDNEQILDEQLCFHKLYECRLWQTEQVSSVVVTKNCKCKFARIHSGPKKIAVLVTMWCLIRLFLDLALEGDQLFILSWRRPKCRFGFLC